MIPEKCRVISLQSKKIYSSFVVRILCWAKGVDLGSNCSSYGIAVFVRHPRSKITIGNGVSFRSDFTSNLVGVNRRCIVAAHQEGSEIIIGDNSGLSGTVIGAGRRISIGKNVLCGANVLITDFDWHNVSPSERRLSAYSRAKPVEIRITYGLV